MSAWQRTLHRIDEVQQRHRWSAFPAAVIRKFGDDGAGGLAALIAYYGFFSLFPLMLVVVSVASSLLRDDPELQARIVDSAIAQFPIVGTQIRDNVGSVAGSPLAIVIGIGAALWAGLAVVASVKTAMDEIWDVPRRKRGSMIPRVLRSSIVLVVLGVTVTAAALAAGAASSLGPFSASAGLIIALLLNVGTMLVVFRVLTVADVSWRDVLPGAVLAGVAWTLLQSLGRVLPRAEDHGSEQRLRNVRGRDRLVVVAVHRRAAHRRRGGGQRRAPPAPLAAVVLPASHRARR